MSLGRRNCKTRLDTMSFVGICMHEGSWFALNQRVANLKARYCSPGQDFELHVKQFAVTISEQGQVPNFSEMSWTERRAQVLQIRQSRIDAAPSNEEKGRLRNKYRLTEPFIHLTRQERSRLLEDALDLVGSHERIRLFAEAVSKSHPRVIAGDIDLVRQAFEQVVSRFDTYLQLRHRWRLDSNPRAPMENGLLILDQDYSTEAVIRTQFEGFRQHGHPWGDLRHVIDVPFFANSEQLVGLQLADVCAYGLRRYLDTNAVPGSHEERNFQRIFHRFDQDGQGRLHGLRHFVQVGTCSCLICQRRGHAAPPAPPSTPPPTQPAGP